MWQIERLPNCPRHSTASWRISLNIQDHMVNKKILDLSSVRGAYRKCMVAAPQMYNHSTRTGFYIGNCIEVNKRGANADKFCFLARHTLLLRSEERRVGKE